MLYTNFEWMSTVGGMLLLFLFVVCGVSIARRVSSEGRRHRRMLLAGIYLLGIIGFGGLADSILNAQPPATTLPSSASSLPVAASQAAEEDFRGKKLAQTENWKNIRKVMDDIEVLTTPLRGDFPITKAQQADIIAHLESAITSASILENHQKLSSTEADLLRHTLRYYQCSFYFITPTDDRFRYIFDYDEQMTRLEIERLETIEKNLKIIAAGEPLPVRNLSEIQKVIESVVMDQEYESLFYPRQVNAKRIELVGRIVALAATLRAEIAMESFVPEDCFLGNFSGFKVELDFGYACNDKRLWTARNVNEEIDMTMMALKRKAVDEMYSANVTKFFVDEIECWRKYGLAIVNDPARIIDKKSLKARDDNCQSYTGFLTEPRAAFYIDEISKLENISPIVALICENIVELGAVDSDSSLQEPGRLYEASEAQKQFDDDGFIANRKPFLTPSIIECAKKVQEKYSKQEGSKDKEFITQANELVEKLITVKARAKEDWHDWALALQRSYSMARDIFLNPERWKLSRIERQFLVEYFDDCFVQYMIYPLFPLVDSLKAFLEKESMAESLGGGQSFLSSILAAEIQPEVYDIASPVFLFYSNKESGPS